MTRKESKERRREAATVRREAAAEREMIRNAERESKLADREVKRRIREERGGRGVELKFYSVRMPGGKVKVKRRKRNGKR